MPRTAQRPSGRSRATPRRGDHARRGVRRPATGAAAQRTEPLLRVGWARRVGIAGALVVAGVSVAVAAQSLGPGGPDTRATASPTHAPAVLAAFPAPVLDAVGGVTRARLIDVTGHLAAALPAGGPFEVRIYVNDKRRGFTRLNRRDPAFTVQGVPLAEGPNSITAVVAGSADETARSAPITVERDTTAPVIDITAPRGSVAYGETMLLSGTTEPEATVSALARANGARVSTSAGAGGAFSLLVPLRWGANTIDITAVDAAGNEAHTTLDVSRVESQAAVTLTLSRDRFDLDTLPQSISMLAQVVGPDGKPLDGAEATFSISPPGQMTVTHDATTVAGSASWSNYPLTRDGAVKGEGLVTLLVTLPGGQTLAASASFTFR